MTKVTDDQLMDEQLIMLTSQLMSVRQPAPVTVSKASLATELEKMQPIYSNPDFIEGYPGGVAALKATVTDILFMQWRYFNRKIWQTTPESLADVVTVCLTVTSDGEFNLINNVLLCGAICDFLEQSQLAADVTQMGDRFMSAIGQRRPDVIFKLHAQLVALDEQADLNFDNHPLVLSHWGNSLAIFCQPGGNDADFQEFIEAMVQRPKAAQLQLAYAFFNDRYPLAVAILDSVHDLNSSRRSKADKQQTVFWELLDHWDLIDELSTRGVVALMQVYQCFLKFCLNKSLMTKADYQQLLKLGNQSMLVRLMGRVVPASDDNTDEVELEQGLALADAICTPTDYTVDLGQARAKLVPLKLKNALAVYRRKTSILRLKNNLDAHQLMLELRQVSKHLKTMDLPIPAEDGDLAVYQDQILALHTVMVQRYNRRLRRWTYDSLVDCLRYQFVNDRKVDDYPAYLRFLMQYLMALDTQGYTDQQGGLVQAVLDTVGTYLSQSTNALAKGKRL